MSDNRCRTPLPLDDGSGAVPLTEGAVHGICCSVDSHVATDVTDETPLLQQQDGDGAASCLNAIPLDVDPPGSEGNEVLSQFKRDKSLRRIPTVVVSTPSATPDAVWGEGPRANLNLSTSVTPDELAGLILSAWHIWLTPTHLPRQAWPLS